MTTLCKFFFKTYTTHQLTRVFVRFGDEYDETRMSINTRTLVLSVADLINPSITGFHIAPTNTAIDHNQYILGQYVFQVGIQAVLLAARIFSLCFDGEGKLSIWTPHSRDYGPCNSNNSGARLLRHFPFR